MRRTAPFTLLLALTVTTLFAQTDVSPMTNSDVLRLVAARISDDEIVLAIEGGAVKFDVSDDAFANLKRRGVSDAVLAAMRNASVPQAGEGHATEAETGATETLTNDSIVRMLAAGIQADVIVLAIQRAPNTHFNTTEEGLTQLSRSGAPAGVLKAMIDPSSKPSPLRAEITNTPQVATAATRIPANVGPPVRRFSVIIKTKFATAPGIVAVSHDRLELTNTKNGRSEFSEPIATVQVKRVIGPRWPILEVKAKSGKSFTALYEEWESNPKGPIVNGHDLETVALSEVAQTIENARNGKPLSMAGPQSAIRLYVSLPEERGFVDASTGARDSVQDLLRILPHHGVFTLVSSRAAADVVVEVVGRGSGDGDAATMQMPDGTPMSLGKKQQLWLQAAALVGDTRKVFTASDDGGLLGIGWAGLAAKIAGDLYTWCDANRSAILAKRVAIPQTIVGEHAVTGADALVSDESRRSDAIVYKPASLPTIDLALTGSSRITIVNPNSYGVQVQLRTGRMARNFDVPPGGSASADGPAGMYNIFFIHSDEPQSLYQGDDVEVSDRSVVTITLTVVPGGNYSIRKVK